jgi:predicted DNA-binding protein with PD1-like motif
VYTTAEIVISTFPGMVFKRQPCELSGYDELVIEPA